MEQLFGAIFGPLLDWLGINSGQQLICGVAMYLALFVAYAARYRKRDTALGALFLIMGLSLLVLLFTESRRVQQVSLAVLVASTIAAFVRDHLCQKRLRQERTT